MACKKTIVDIDLNESNPQVVIEANYSAEDSVVRVQLSFTSSYFNNDPSMKIDGATVTITDELGSVQGVPNTVDGSYVLENYVPIINSSYQLDVTYNGEIYNAHCYLNDAVPLEAISYVHYPDEFKYDVFYGCNDPSGTNDYYRAVVKLGGESQGSKINFSDEFNDGNFLEHTLSIYGTLSIGDTVKVELRTIDENVYEYFGEIFNLQYSDGSAAVPANPKNNWSNGALGYFSAYSSSRELVVIQ